MSYLPRMISKIDGLSVSSGLHRRYWNGMVADLWSVDCQSDAGGQYVSNDPRLFILLDAAGEDGADLSMAEGGGKQISGAIARAAHFIPAGLEMSTAITGVKSLRHLDLHFDADILLRRLGEDAGLAALHQPRYLLDDPRLLALAELIAADVANPQPLHDLYGDGLVSALLIDVLNIRPTPARQLPHRKRSKLAAWQLRRVCDFIEAHCLRTIRLEELAGLAGLSPTYFSHAFKASTGLSPHQWQMKARIETVKQRLRDPAVPLTVIAAETGFADAAHFARSFRRAVGLSPSEWRRVRLN
ncbi:helix-turn-helix transcriptional regulator [Agrobacterium vitis]|nr:AraC family transcriptional regulator [Agrobacterium vitis]NSY13088.1 helix-turn-helix transcriptional regulator [Agrobacterium vitis]NSY22845.1 helix-turn-helix transcriptional regulator [Agrobacterium vitis]NTA22549.1 helix-turn-helix transcriptional regulator [Agrobacterium vitis]WEO70816.1 AraC family transcriptional regulator [Agrobacterium vitis]